MLHISHKSIRTEEVIENSIYKLDDVKCNISISHDGDYATAFAIIE